VSLINVLGLVDKKLSFSVDVCQKVNEAYSIASIGLHWHFVGIFLHKVVITNQFQIFKVS